jgi:hypothetical protein
VDPDRQDVLRAIGHDIDYDQDFDEMNVNRPHPASGPQHVRTEAAHRDVALSGDQPLEIGARMNALAADRIGRV